MALVFGKLNWEEQSTIYSNLSKISITKPFQIWSEIKSGSHQPIIKQLHIKETSLSCNNVHNSSKSFLQSGQFLVVGEGTYVISHHFQHSCLGHQNPRWHWMTALSHLKPKGKIQAKFWHILILWAIVSSERPSNTSLDAGDQGSYADVHVYYCTVFLLGLRLTHGTLIWCQRPKLYVIQGILVIRKPY